MANLNFNASNHKPYGAQTVELDDQPCTIKTPSVHQLRIFDFVEAAPGNAVIEAVAGSGKTTTIVEAVRIALKRGLSALFLAFNKSIQLELQKRGVNAKTFHGLTYSVVLRHVGAREIEQNKLMKLCDAVMDAKRYSQLSEAQKLGWMQPAEDDYELYNAFARRLVGLARQVGIGCLVQDTQQAWMDICVQHDLEPESEFADLGRGIEWAQTLLKASNCYMEHKYVDFDDLLYIAVKDGLVLPKFDFVFVDEAQDTNAIQRALLRKVLHSADSGRTSRIIAVGDPAQAIYGFRGADSESLNLIATEFNCARLPLSISYRCSQAVVNYARQWVSHIEAAPNAPEGEVLELGTNWTTKTFAADDMVVCRTTAPLITLAFKLLRAHVPVRIMGKEIGQGLKSLITKMKAGNLDHLEAKLEAWRDREVEKATAKREEAKAEAIADKVACILCLIDALPENERTINALMLTLDKLFAEGVNQVLLSTIHKAKGLEAVRVFWLNRSKCPSPWARQEWQQEQERNLCYVAATRAKLTLVIIEEPEEK
jgi:DNA helicase-2/ATP-dependent DNA helicase PcrA